MKIEQVWLLESIREVFGIIFSKYDGKMDMHSM